MRANQINKFKEVDLQTEMENIYNILNKIGIYGDNRDTSGQRAENIDMYIVDGVTNAIASEDTEITHDLLKIPNFYTILTQSASGGFYEGSGTNSESSFFIKCSVAGANFTIGLW